MGAYLLLRERKTTDLWHGPLCQSGLYRLQWQALPFSPLTRKNCEKLWGGGEADLCWVWGEGSEGRVFVYHAQSPGFSPQNHISCVVLQACTPQLSGGGSRRSEVQGHLPLHEAFETRLRYETLSPKKQLFFSKLENKTFTNMCKYLVSLWLIFLFQSIDYFLSAARTYL